MKIEKNKLLFGGIIAVVLLFIVGYSTMLLGDGEEADTELKQTQVPELEDEQKAYSSKLDAVNDIKEKRESNAPSVYDVTLLDSTGLYDPARKEKERQLIVDSIYRHGRINYESGNYREQDIASDVSLLKGKKNPPNDKESAPLRNFKPTHAAFFNSAPFMKQSETIPDSKMNDDFVVVEVNGEQTVRTDGRLELRLAVDAVIEGKSLPRNTLIYGFVSFKANRVLLNITNIGHRKVSLKAYDLLDGNEGIYIENSFRAEASREVLDDLVQDINIAGVPQIGGIKQIFRRNNRHVKVTVRNQYQLILKSAQAQ